MTGSNLLRFLAGVALGTLLAVVVGVSLTPPRTSQAGDAVPVVASTDAPHVPLPSLATTQTLQLASYVEAAGPTDGTTERAPWWNAGVPRVPAITQFDGGPLANVNCTMASAAMLARLTFGIVTTGSQMRALQDDQEGGTSLLDAQAAVDNGWGVRFSRGALSPLQLRALMYAGAGAEIAGLYREIPVDTRLQRNFTEGHAIYLDGFREAGPEGPAAYYVIDPLGHSWSGYRGAWWPADIVERFGTVFGSGRIKALWGFPGGTAPIDHPILPRSAYPSTGPSASASPGSSPGASEDPMPAGDTGPLDDVDEGTTPPDVPTVPAGEAMTGSSRFADLLARCAVAPRPSDCPPGLVGRAVIPVGPVPSGSIAAISAVVLRYVNQIGPGTWQIIFESPPDSSPQIWVWPGDAQGQVTHGSVEAALLDGQPVSLATVTADPAQSFTFFITTADGDRRATSQVGSVTVP